ncbi:TetR/AcrR family transcriptional regulator [Nocardia vaccinii]|uniref:TetR/AcrR family transcriptional regulator n=1 Tax=Nocardia vaccinii TaxID=1822 RepID=UPI000A78175C|nr:TetR/AcrR family transcriptional regulator [Nocardia vaccinii]
MPRLTPQRWAARRQQILDGARGCFLRNGFHATSMKEVVEAAQMSPGAVYNHFASKDELVAAICEQALAEVTNTFEQLSGEQPLPPLAEAVTAVFGHTAPLDAQRDSARLLVQIWAEAIRSPALAARVEPIFRTVRGVLATLVTRYQDQDLLPRTTAAEEIADILLATLQGTILRDAVLGDVDLTALQRGFRALWPTATTTPSEPPLQNKTQDQHGQPADKPPRLHERLPAEARELADPIRPAVPSNSPVQMRNDAH